MSRLTLRLTLDYGTLRYLLRSLSSEIFKTDSVAVVVTVFLDRVVVIGTYASVD